MNVRMSGMSVVNVKVKYIRPRGYHDLSEWMKDDNHVYIGRKGVVFIEGTRFPKSDSPFANPFKIGRETRDEVIAKYESYMRERLRNEPELARLLIQLDGKELGCWCKPERCHGDVLLKLLKERSIQSPSS